MATFILLFGLALLFTEVFAQPGQGLLIENPNRTILVFIFIFYAVYRYVRGWQLYKKNMREEKKKSWETP